MKRKRDCKDKNRFMFLWIFLLLSVFCIIIGALCINNLKHIWIRRRLRWSVCIFGGMIGALYGVTIWAVIKEKNVAIKGLLTAYVFLGFALSLLWIFQETGFLEVFNNPEYLQEYLENAGALMPVLYILLQFLQVVILPIPSIVSTVVGVTLFGAFKSALYSCFGIILGSLLAFYVGRRWGNRAVKWLVGDKKMKQWQEKLKGKDKVALTVMFLLPMFPDDILCFFAGISSMSWKYFTVMMSISRVIAITSTCYSFDLIPLNTWWGALSWIIIIGAIVAMSVIVYKNLDKIQAWLKAFRKSRGNKKSE